ncbi:hypothetical protein A2801_01550 [Candidatus Woesebacteria bacterium RIFCSPHIGHO2_01_FULL_41_10]|uniref:histidine kinase n=1 Tax=Candidatus Woesebacteria bacterium RIFCSPHIGHO2_01_FULL_41_10 TaxID=1802500 RepID=A0A1F7YQ09_9BACT|nr:MAG: hypothetical protein A2801_01550 [Candidatus Woesebacteria bacterium RIFCSPHIGHO2_01_FULL_41_10]
MAFYHVSTREIQRVLTRVQMIEEQWQGRFRDFPQPPPGAPSLEELQASKERLLVSLVFINGIILVGAGGAAYFLAGKTLKPIKLMVDEQNQFISNSSHEVRTPLATLRAELEGGLLEKHISDKMARKILSSNLEEVDRLQGLSNKLLQLTKLHNFSSTKYTELISLKGVVETATKQVQTLANSKEIKIELTLKDSVVQGDKDSLRELFVILLDNAIKYSAEESKVKVTFHDTEDVVKVSIKDQGIGIPEEDLEHIFERFYRSDKSRSQTGGFGLGLSIAKQIVEKHNGTIKIVSEVGKGSTFIIFLPLVKS